MEFLDFKSCCQSCGFYNWLRCYQKPTAAFNPEDTCEPTVLDPFPVRIKSTKTSFQRILVHCSCSYCVFCIFIQHLCWHVPCNWHQLALPKYGAKRLPDSGRINKQYVKLRYKSVNCKYGQHPHITVQHHERIEARKSRFGRNRRGQQRRSLMARRPACPVSWHAHRRRRQQIPLVELGDGQHRRFKEETSEWT